MKNDATGQDLLREIGEETLRLLELGWTQEVEARNEWKRVVPLGSSTACMWCLVGAIERAKGDLFPGPDANYTHDDLELAQLTLTRMLGVAIGEQRAGFGDLMRWNDAPGRTKEEVLALVRDVVGGLKR